MERRLLARWWRTACPRSYVILRLIEMDVYEIGTAVYTTDGQAGKLNQIVVDPYSKRVTDLVIQKGFLLKSSRVIPVELVDEMQPGRIRLSIHSREMTNYPEYREKEFTAPDPHMVAEKGVVPDQTVQWALRYGQALAGIKPTQPRIRKRVHEGVDPDRSVIGRGTRVYNGTETVGYIDHLLVDNESGEITHLILRRGLLPFRAVVPFSMVKEVTDDGVFVLATRQELKSLSQYTPRPDQDILDEVQERLQTTSHFDLSQVRTTLVDGLVKLSGSVANLPGKWEADRIVAGVKGVLGIENEIVVDAEIEARVAAALLKEPQTFRADIEVKSEQGVVTLSGVVDSQAARTVAEATAAAQEDVQAVNNQLLISAKSAPDARKKEADVS